MDIRKYAAKLRQMSPEEIRFRVRQQLRQRGEQLRWKISGGKRNGSLFVPAWIEKWNVEAHPFPAENLAFFGLADDPAALRQAYDTHFKERRAPFLRQTQGLLAHRFRFLGLEVELPDPLPWNGNPQTGREYPLHPHSRMDTFNTERYGDVKFVWELNRHQFFIEVAKAYFLTGEERYAEKLWLWLESWVEHNPHKLGINHTSVLEHAVRIFSWTWAYFFTRQSQVWTPERRAVLARNLLLQGEMIEENLSFYYSPYNHLIGELAALSFLGTVYGNSAKLKKWRDHYWQALEEQLPRQFHTDGFTVEQASYYHHFTLGFYVMVALLRRQNGLPVSPGVWETLERALEVPLYLTRPDGRLPMLGDIDSARSVYFYRPDPQWNLRPFLALGATLFERSDLKYLAGEPAEELLWLLGREKLERFQKLPARSPERTSRAFPASGYLVMRDGWTKTASYACFDCGEIAHGVFKDDTPSAAHGHADILSLELSPAGRPLVIDPGFHTYFGPLEWHRYFRSTRGHNTVEVNRAGQAVHRNRIGWSRVSSPQLLHWAAGPGIDFAAAAIDRFAPPADKVFQRRYLLFVKRCYFLILDEICAPGSSPLDIESSWHFAPGHLEHRDGRLFFNDQLVGLLALPEEAEVQIEKGGTRPNQGWMAEGYGCKTPAPVLRIRARQTPPLRLATLFPISGFAEKVHSLEILSLNSEVWGARIRRVQGEESLYVNPRRRSLKPPQEPQFQTDALGMLLSGGTDQEFESHFFKLNHLHFPGNALHLRLDEKEAVGATASGPLSGKLNLEIWE